MSIKGGPAYKFPWDALSMVPTLAPARRRRKISVEWGGTDTYCVTNFVNESRFFKSRFFRTLENGLHDSNVFRMSSKTIIFAKGANFLYYSTCRGETLRLKPGPEKNFRSWRSAPRREIKPKPLSCTAPGWEGRYARTKSRCWSRSSNPRIENPGARKSVLRCDRTRHATGPNSTTLRSLAGF